MSRDRSGAQLAFALAPRARCTRLLLLALLGVATLGPARASSALEAGDPAVDFDRPTLDGDRTIALADHLGKVIYLDFWASWCNPCQAAIPKIEELRRQFPASEFQVLAVNLDHSAEKAKKFLAKHPVGYPSVSDPKGELPRVFGLETMPTSYLIDRDGVIRYVHRGFRKGDEEELRKRIAALVRAKPSPASRKRASGKR